MSRVPVCVVIINRLRCPGHSLFHRPIQIRLGVSPGPSMVCLLCVNNYKFIGIIIWQLIYKITNNDEKDGLYMTKMMAFANVNVCESTLKLFWNWSVRLPFVQHSFYGVLNLFCEKALLNAKWLVGWSHVIDIFHTILYCF